MRSNSGNLVDTALFILNDVSMDALTDRVLLERIKILQARLDLAVQQRDRFASNYHEVTRIPHQERREIMEDCDDEILRAGRTEKPGQPD